MAKKKFYAVRKGTVTGIFDTWGECKEAVDGYSKAEYKSFSTLGEAENYLGMQVENTDVVNKEINVKVDSVKSAQAYIDGSYDNKLKRYSYGFLLILPDGEKQEYSDFRDDENGLASWNVAGELLGATIAIKKAVELGFEKLQIFYDYEGIEKWATGEWKAKKLITKDYVDFIKDYNEKIKIEFNWVKAHSGNEYNELVDRLAKNALRKDEKPKFGDNNLVVNNVKPEDIETIMQIIEEDEDYSIDIRKNNDVDKTTWSLHHKKEKLSAIHFYKSRKLLVQGKKSSLFSILSSFVSELVDDDQIAETLNQVYKIEVDKEVVENEYSLYLPNKKMKFDTKLDNTFKQAIYNLQLEGDMYDHTHLSFPALRGLEGFMKTILNNYKIDCADSFHCFVPKDKVNNTYKLDQKYEVNVGSPKKIQYLNRTYDYYRKHRHTLFHWDEKKVGKDDTTRVLYEKDWKIIITDTLELVDNYFTTS